MEQEREEYTPRLVWYRVVIRSKTEGVCKYEFCAETVDHAYEQFVNSEFHKENDIINIRIFPTVRGT